MPSSKHIILVGDSELLMQFMPLLVQYGIRATEISHVRLVMEAVIKEHPDAIVFVLPRYWDDITHFVKKLRAEKECAQTPILYVGSLIEGEDQRVLHQMGVKTLTLGPLLPQEVVRYIADMLE